MANITHKLEGDGLYWNRWVTGLVTQRSPLTVPISAMGLQVREQADALIDGLNCEISRTMTVQRRPAYVRYCTTALGASDYPLNYHSFKKLDGTLYNLVDTPTRVSVFTPSGVYPIYYKASAARMSFRSIGNTTYMCNGTDAVKWMGGTNLLQYSEQFDNGLWTKQTNVTVTPNSTTDPNGGNTADTITTGATAGVGVLQTSTATAINGTTTATFSVWLKATSGTQNVNIGVNSPTAGNQQSTTVTATTTWTRFSVTHNATWTGNVGIGVLLQVTSASSSVYVWGAQLDFGNAAYTYESVTSRPGGPVTKWGIVAPVTAPTIDTPTAGSLSPTVGYSWGYVFKASTTGHVSTMSPASANIGKQTNKQFTLHGDRSTDPQVDKIEIYRIDDGGENYYYLATVNNPTSGTWTYTDNLPDTSLNDFIIAPLQGNDPPLAGSNLTEFHIDRMWVASGNNVYYGSGPDVTNGVPEECFAADAVFTFPGQVTALTSTSIGLLVWTAESCYVILGSNLATFYPKLWQGNFGVPSAKCVVQDGDNLFVFTTRGFLFYVGAGLEEIGFNVRGKLAAFDVTKVSLALHRSGEDEGLFISDGVSNIYRYSVALNCWSPVAQPVGGVGVVGSIETSTGVYRLLAGRTAGSGYILTRDLNQFADDGGAYPAYATVGSLVLAPPGRTATVKSVMLEMMPVGTYPTLSVLLNEVSGSFVTLPNPQPDPPELSSIPQVSVLTKRHYLTAAQTQLAVRVRHMQVKVDFGTEAFKSEMLGLAIG